MMISILQISAAFFIGLVIVYYAIPIIVRISIEKHLYDVPNERKVNKTVIPNLGGIALFVGISIATLLCIFENSFPDWRYILSCMIILFFVGIKDDILIISARKKFAAQILCALILVILGDIRLTHFHGILGINEINYFFSLIISSLTIVGIINALNLIDGIDGLAASIAILASMIFGFLFFSSDDVNYALLCFATTGSLISFFIFNVFGKKNKIFMGDTGSLTLGLILSVCAIKYNESTIGGNEVMFNLSPILSLALLSVPMFDLVRLFLIRIFQGKSPFVPDMNHIHHKFLKLGLSHRMTTMIIVLTNVFIIGIIFVFRGLNNHILLILLTLLVAFFMVLPDFIYEFIKSQNSFAKRIRFQSYFIPYKNSFYHQTHTSSPKSIVLIEIRHKTDKLKQSLVNNLNSGNAI
ncbi:MAG TPA: undecaprenyl/decaprenyl-phosphate alpha-N-acetylglucosaminyl 1-phosphate transferase [Prolixibacteraceae bacterium]|nr:undecaprenyl/decaprenyl-phosphate alpha-N-acetylglucosaminyl 1-phosphate transferase [Prolixibacteraceae bacterium]